MFSSKEGKSARLRKEAGLKYLCLHSAITWDQVFIVLIVNR